MRTHHEAEEEDDEGGKWVQRERIGFRGLPAIDERWRMTEFGWSGCHRCIEKISYSLRLDEHAALSRLAHARTLDRDGGLMAHQSTTEEHDRDRYMFEILSSPGAAPSR